MAGTKISDATTTAPTGTDMVPFERVADAVARHMTIDALFDRAIVINESGAAVDFRVESDDYDAINVDGTNNELELMKNAAGKIAFFGATPVVKQTEITDELTTVTHTAPGTPDYALQDLVDSGAGSAFGFATKDEGNSALAVIANLQARVNDLETKLVNLGLLTDAD